MNSPEVKKREFSLIVLPRASFGLELIMGI